MSQVTLYRGEVKRIALAGGIGAGKSTVVDYLRSEGHVAIDADEVYRQLTALGQPLLDALVDAFGAAALSADGELDRSYLASIVFTDPAALRQLNAITHGPIGLEIRRQLDASTGDVGFVALPLFRAEHRAQLALDEMWSVQVTPEVALDRLVAQRAMTPDSARARIAAQASNVEREQLADEVLWNNTDRESLFARVDELLRERGFDDH
jgi:dephospho-CoA kinase